MLEHIRKKIPEMRVMLEKELSSTTEKLEEIGREPHSPLAVAVVDSNRMAMHLTKAYESFQSKHRRITEHMSSEIFKLTMKPLGIIDNDAEKRFEEDWQYEKYEKPNHELLVLALEAQKIGNDNRSMINEPYVGKKSELEAWLQQFAEPLEKILKKYIDDLYEAFLLEIVRPSIRKGSSELTSVLSNELEFLAGNTVRRAENDALEYAKHFVDSVKKNTFTTNRLSSKVEALGSISCGIYRDLVDIVNEIGEFLELRKQVLPDAIQLYVTKALGDLFEATKEELGKQMVLNTSRIKEPPRLVAQRKKLLDREQRIMNALSEIIRL